MFCKGLTAIRDKEKELRRRLFELEKKVKRMEKVLGSAEFLNDSDRMLFRLYYGLPPYRRNHTYQELADMYGISAERAKQVVYKILRTIERKSFFSTGKDKDPLYVQYARKYPEMEKESSSLEKEVNEDVAKKMKWPSNL